MRSWARASRLNEGLTNRGFESSLATLPIVRRGSVVFQAVTVALLAATWVAGWAVTGRWWR